jgi:hypothetical protein
LRCAITVLFLHLLATVARLAGPGGVRAVVAESVLVKHQPLILNRLENGRPISVRLLASCRSVCGLHAPESVDSFRDRLQPSTLLSLHRALVQRKLLL